MYKRMWGLVAAAALIAACSSDSNGPSKGPDLTGTWGLVSVDIGNTGNPVGPPTATGSFVFDDAAKTVDITLHVDSPPAPQVLDVSGSGTYTQTGTKLNLITGIPLIGQAAGTYVFKDGGAAPDTLTVDMVSSGQHTTVVVVRP